MRLPRPSFLVRYVLMKNGLKNKGTGTQVVTGGRRPEWTGPIVNPPIWRASTHLYEDVAALKKGPMTNEDGRFFYGRRGSPTQWSLCDALTQLEPGAAGTVLYPSGVAAIAGVLLAVLSPGDVLLMTDNAYDPSRSMGTGLLQRMGIECRFFDPLIGSGITDVICDRTRAVWLESPGSLTMEVQDVPGIAAAAKAHNPDICVMMDNTWATPVNFPALAHGCDISVLACTKYIVGHSDVMMGSATANDHYYPEIRKTSQALGQVVSPDDAWLALRGLRTLEVRLRQHQESALAIARWLEKRPEVSRVLHPALPSCPGHDLFTRDFGGSTGLFSFVFKAGSDKARSAFIDALNLFGIGFSWGGFESLALPVNPQNFRDVVRWPLPGAEDTDTWAVRLHIGLESTDDLIADLDQAFKIWRLQTDA